MITSQKTVWNNFCRTKARVSEMASILKGVEIFGALILCTPPRTRLYERYAFSQNFCNLKRVLLSILHGSVSICNISVFLDTVLSNSPETITGTPKFTEYVGVWCAYGTTVLSDAIIRFTGLFFICDMAIMLSDFRPKSDYAVPANNDKRDYFSVISALITSVLAVSCSVSLVMIDLNIEFRPDFHLTIIPWNHPNLIRALYVFCSVSFSLSYWFAWLFVILASSHFITWINQYSAACCNTTLGPTTTLQEISDLRAEFESIKKAYESFNRVGGAYCLSLLLSSTIFLIRFLSGVSSPGDSHVAFQEGTQFFCYLLPIGIIVLAAMGTRMASAVRYSIATIFCVTSYSTLLGVLQGVPASRSCLGSHFAASERKGNR